jgi:hypothetical protein
LWILTNDEHVNFRIAAADPAAPGDWTTVIAGSDRVYLRELTSHRDHLAVTERVDGLDQLRLRSYDGRDERIVPFAEAALFGRSPKQSRRLRRRPIGFIIPHGQARGRTIDYTAAAAPGWRPRKVTGDPVAYVCLAI